MLFLALAAVFLGGSREVGTSMLLLCALAVILAACGEKAPMKEEGGRRKEE